MSLVILVRDIAEGTEKSKRVNAQVSEMIALQEIPTHGIQVAATGITSVSLRCHQMNLEEMKNIAITLSIGSKWNCHSSDSFQRFPGGGVWD